MQGPAAAQPPIQYGMMAPQLAPGLFTANMQPAMPNIAYPAVPPIQLNSNSLQAQAGNLNLSIAGTNLQHRFNISRIP